jgi:hypothetical protein
VVKEREERGEKTVIHQNVCGMRVPPLADGLVKMPR